MITRTEWLRSLKLQIGGAEQSNTTRMGWDCIGIMRRWWQFENRRNAWDTVSALARQGYFRSNCTKTAV